MTRASSSRLDWLVVPFALPLRRPFVTARRIYKVRRGWWLRVTDADGAIGLGEASPLPSHGGELADATAASIAILTSAIDGGAVPGSAANLEELESRIIALAPDAPAARAAIACALTDLSARRAGLPLARWLYPTARSALPVNATIDAVEADQAVAQALAAKADGFGTLKVKLNAGLADAGLADAGLADVARLAAVRAAVGPAVKLRADANGAWRRGEALRRLRDMEFAALEYLEQPLAAADVAGMAALRAGSPVPIAADESLLVPGGPAAVLAAGAADVLVLKPALLGGPGATLALAATAAEHGLPVVVTTAIDGAIGRAMAAHVAAAIPRAQMPYACGLATGMLLQSDVAQSLLPVQGSMAVFGGGAGADPCEPGLGIPGDAIDAFA